jgi:tetratricopeptide (TPR) repeat protein
VGDLAILDQQESLVGFLLAGQSYFLASTTGGQVLPEKMIAQLLGAKPGDRRKEAIGLGYLSFALVYQGKSVDSRSFAELGLALATETEESLGKWLCLMTLGNPRVHSQPAVAKKYLEKALTVCLNSGDATARGYSYLNLGRAYVELGRYGMAAHYFEQVSTIFSKFQNVRALGYNLEDMGRLKTALGDYTAAIRDFQNALTFYYESRAGERTAAYCRVWLGIALRLQGDFQRAEKLTEETLATFRALNDPMIVGYCLLNLGCLAQERGMLNLAEQLQREALTVWRKAEQEARVADASRYLGHLLIVFVEPRHAEARRYYRQALDLSLKHQLAPIALDVFVGVAQLLACVGQMENATELLALAEGHEASTFETQKNARSNLAKLVDQLVSEQARVAQARGRTLDLWTSVGRVLATLAEKAN